MTDAIRKAIARTALPWTMLGVALVAVSGGRPYTDIDQRASWPVFWAVRPMSFAGRLLGRIGMTAITVGRTIIIKTEFVGNKRPVSWLERHELLHVEQFERWGFLFPLAYGVASIVSRLRHGNWYRDNAFEVEARRAE